jgi:hypothetical protein
VVVLGFLRREHVREKNLTLAAGGGARRGQRRAVDACVAWAHAAWAKAAGAAWAKSVGLCLRRFESYS